MAAEFGCKKKEKSALNPREKNCAKVQKKERCWFSPKTASLCGGEKKQFSNSSTEITGGGNGGKKQGKEGGYFNSGGNQIYVHQSFHVLGEKKKLHG